MKWAETGQIYFIVPLEEPSEGMLKYKKDSVTDSLEYENSTIPQDAYFPIKSDIRCDFTASINTSQEQHNTYIRSHTPAEVGKRENISANFLLFPG